MVSTGSSTDREDSSRRSQYDHRRRARGPAGEHPEGTAHGDGDHRGQRRQQRHAVVAVQCVVAHHGGLRRGGTGEAVVDARSRRASAACDVVTSSDEALGEDTACEQPAGEVVRRLRGEMAASVWSQQGVVSAGCRHPGREGSQERRSRSGASRPSADCSACRRSSTAESAGGQCSELVPHRAHRTGAVAQVGGVERDVGGEQAQLGEVGGEAPAVGGEVLRGACDEVEQPLAGVAQAAVEQAQHRGRQALLRQHDGVHEREAHRMPMPISSTRGVGDVEELQRGVHRGESRSARRCSRPA